MLLGPPLRLLGAVAHRGHRDAPARVPHTQQPGPGRSSGEVQQAPAWARLAPWVLLPCKSSRSAPEGSGARPLCLRVQPAQNSWSVFPSSSSLDPHAASAPVTPPLPPSALSLLPAPVEEQEHLLPMAE